MTDQTNDENFSKKEEVDQTTGLPVFAEGEAEKAAAKTPKVIGCMMIMT